MKPENWELLNSFCKVIKLRISEGGKMKMKSDDGIAILESLQSAEQSTLKILQTILNSESKDGT